MVWTNEEIVALAARELRDGDFLELGCGLPTLIAEHLPKDIEVWVHAETGIPGVELYATDDYMDAGFIASERLDGQTERMRVAFHSTDSYAAILSSSADVAVVEAISIADNRVAIRAPSAQGAYKGERIPAVAAKRVIAILPGETSDSSADTPARLSAPLFATVSRVICSLGVLDVTKDGLRLVQAAGDTSKVEIESVLSVKLLA